MRAAAALLVLATGAGGLHPDFVPFTPDSGSHWLPPEALTPEVLGWAVATDGRAGPGRALSEADAASCDGRFLQQVVDTNGQGSITDMYDATNGYKSYQTCFWRITPTNPGQARITLFFSDFSLPVGGLHYVAVYRVTPAGPVLIRQEPSSLTAADVVPEPVTCECSQMLVKFRSTYFAGSAFAGFRASYSALSFAIRELEPRSGPVDGGTAVTVRGVFAGHANLDCSWSGPGSSVSAAVASESVAALVCIFGTERRATATDYELSVFGQPEGSANAIPAQGVLSFLFYDNPAVDSITPSTGRYGDFVTVTLLQDLHDVATPLCRFGVVDVEAQAVGGAADQVRCAVPMPAGRGGTVDVAVSLNGQQFSPHTMPFDYSDEYCDGTLTLTDASGAFSDHSPAGAGATTVVRSGVYRPYSSCSWLLRPGDAGCRVLLEILRDVDLEPGEDAVEVYDGTVAAPSALLRRYPEGVLDAPDRLRPLVSSGCAMLVRFRSRLLTGRTGFTATFSAQSLGLVSVSPASASTSAGTSTVVTISGQFVTVPDNSTEAECVFDRVATGEARRTLATKVSNSRLTCPVPEWDRADVGFATEAVELSVTDGFQSSPNAVDFLFSQEAVVTAVSPASGTIGSMVTVTGNHFANVPELACRFGDVLSPAATFLSATSVECVAPTPQNPQGIASPDYEVRVSNNGQGFEASDVRFRYAVYCGTDSFGAPIAETLVTSIGTVTDHSGGGAYMPQSRCTFILNPAGAATVKVRFDELSMGTEDTLKLTGGGGAGVELDVLAVASATEGAALPNFELTAPVHIDFRTTDTVFGTGFKLTYLDGAVVEGECPAGGAAGGFTTTQVPAGSALSISVIDSGWAYHEISLATAAADRTLVVSIASDRLQGDGGSGAIATYALNSACPSTEAFNSSATVASAGVLKLFACASSLPQLLYVGVLGSTGDQDYVPYSVSWESQVIAQLNDLDGANNLVRIEPQMVDGEALYAEVEPPSMATRDATSVIHITVLFSNVAYEGNYAGSLSANAGGCGPPGFENYRLTQPDALARTWEISIVEPLASSGCSRTGFGGADRSWVMAFFPAPGVDTTTSTNYEANVQVSVDYTTRRRKPEGNDEVAGEYAIAPGQEHFFSLPDKPILNVQVTPCAFDTAAGAYDCVAAGAQVAAAFEVEAQKDEDGCYTPGESPQATSTADAQGVYRLSACGAEITDAQGEPWVLVVRSRDTNAGPVTYRLQASASNIETLDQDAQQRTFTEQGVFPGDSKFYRVTIPAGGEVDMTATVATEQADRLLTLLATTQGCEQAAIERRDDPSVQVVEQFATGGPAGSEQVYRMTLQACNATTYFVSVYLNTDNDVSTADFSIAFQRRGRAFRTAEADAEGIVPQLSAGEGGAGVGVVSRALLPGAVHTFDVETDPADALTITVTQDVEATVASPTGVLELQVLPVQNATSGTTACDVDAAGADPSLFPYKVSRGEGTTSITYTLTLAECVLERAIVAVRSALAAEPGIYPFTQYSLRLERLSRSFEQSPGASVVGAVAGAQTSLFELVSTTSDRTLVVQVFVPIREVEEGSAEDDNRNALALAVLPDAAVAGGGNGASRGAGGPVSGDGEGLGSCAVAAVDANASVTTPDQFGNEYRFVANLCADVAATYFVQITGRDGPDALNGRSVHYEVILSSAAQVDYAQVLSPAEPTSSPLIVSANTWQFNFMTVPSSSVGGAYRATFALTVRRETTVVVDGAVVTLPEVPQLSDLEVYVSEGRCPTEASRRLDLAPSGFVRDANQVSLNASTKLYIGIRGSWSTTARHAFRLEPSFQCQAGFVSQRYNDTCSPCEPGTYSPEPGRAECLRCRIGEAQPSEGQDRCVACRPGEFQGAPGQTSCANCPAGQFSDQRGASKCTKCDVGTFTAQNGLDACADCPLATTTSSEGSAGPQYCTCVRGFFNRRLASGEACEECPLGAQCDGGSGLQSMPFPQPRYFQDWDETLMPGGTAITPDTESEYYKEVGRPVAWGDRSEPGSAQSWLDVTQQTPRYWDARYFLPCTPAQACTGGRWWEVYQSPDFTFDTNDDYLSVQCATGYANPQGSKQCNRCANGFYRDVSNECVECTTSPLQLVAMAIGLIALAVAMYSVSKSGFNVGALAISVNFFQVTSIFASFEIQWPVQVEVLFRFFEIFQIGIDIAQPECVVPNIGYIEKWLFMMALPLIFLALLCTILLLINSHHWILTRTRFSLWFKRKFPRVLRKPERPRPDEGETRAEQITRVVLTTSQFALYKLGASMVQTSTRETREIVADSIINAFFMFLTLFYLAAVQKALEPFACFPTQFDESGVPGKRVMYADGSIECSLRDPAYRLLAPFGVVAGVVYGMGIPASILSFLYMGRFRLNVMAFGRKFGYLYRRYEREWYFWEVVVLSRKLSLAATRLFLSSHVLAQSTLGIAIITAFLAAQVFARPYEEVHLDMMETVLLSANYVTLFMGFTKHVLSGQPWYTKDQEYAESLEVAIFAVLVACVVFIVFFNVYDISRQLIRLYRRRSLGEGKYGEGQLLHLRHLDPRTEELQVLGQTYMLSSRRNSFISWLMQANAEEKTLFESVFKSFKFFLEDAELQRREEADRRRAERAARGRSVPSFRALRQWLSERTLRMRPRGHTPPMTVLRRWQ